MFEPGTNQRPVYFNFDLRFTMTRLRLRLDMPLRTPPPQKKTKRHVTVWKPIKMRFGKREEKRERGAESATRMDEATSTRG